MKNPKVLFHIHKRHYQIPVNQIKKGQVIEYKNKLLAVSHSSHHTQGRSGAHYKLEFKDLVHGTKSFDRFNSGTTLEGVDLMDKDFHFLYSTSNEITLLGDDSEPVSFPLDLLQGGSKMIPFLLDSMPIQVSFHENQPVVLQVPDKASFKVIDTTEPSSTSIKDTKATVFKSAILETNVEIKVPDFIKTGEVICVSLQDFKYLSRSSSASSVLGNSRK